VSCYHLTLYISYCHRSGNPLGPANSCQPLSPYVAANTITTLRDLTLPLAGPSRASRAVPSRPLQLRTISDSAPVPRAPRATDRRRRPRRWVAAAVSVTALPVQALVDDGGAATRGGVLRELGTRWASIDRYLGGTYSGSGSLVLGRHSSVRAQAHDDGTIIA